MEFIFFIIALLASVAGAITGVGGGIVIKPVLDATNMLTPDVVNFLSGNTVLAMTIVSLGQNLVKKDAKIEWRRTVFLAIGAAVGGIGGGAVFNLIKTAAPSLNVVKLIQSICLLIITAGVLVYVRKKDKIRSLDVKNPLAAIVIGLTLGVVSSFLGIGGGPLNIAFLYYFFSMSPKTAAINSLLIIFFSQVFNLGSTLIGGTVPVFSPLVQVLMCVGAVGGALTGRYISSKIKESQVDLLFQIFMLLISLLNVYNIVTISLVL